MMTFCYSDEKRLVETQAKNGRLSKTAAHRQLELLMEDEADRLEKMADHLSQSDRVTAAGYRQKAMELRESIAGELVKVAGTGEVATAVRMAVAGLNARSRQTESRISTLERTTYAGSPDARPIGMPSPAGVQPDLVKSARRPDNGPVLTAKPTSQMTNEEKASYYARLARAATTGEEFRMWDEVSRKCAEAARQEGI